ncbi:hypothetical protein BGZ73_003191 [Actinomortierella ambigua]|nr:hypothetical protein BGZ73_003191 [Actinomortierella ambigua]
MWAKAFCIAISRFTYYWLNVPPKAGMNVSEKEDKVGKDGIYADILRRFTTDVAPWQAITFTLVYLYLMAKGVISSNLEWWIAGATILQMLSCALCLQAFAELDRYFTYTITIRKDHQLVTTGPYKYLRHPSYTGFLFGGVSFHMVMIYGGLWESLVYSVTNVHLPAYVALAASTAFYGVPIVTRINKEEAMLSGHFGAKMWNNYTSQRYRLVPLVY